jgi:multidrug efflux pump subunit AcrB
LGLRSAIIVIITIPVSVFAAVGFIDIAGYGLQQMSIAGLIIALGMLVDNSIAVVENIYRYIGKGFKPIDAAIKSISEIGLALVSSTVTTVLAFVPMLMMNNDVGNFIKSMVLIVIYALLASLFVALCLTPFLGSRLLKKSNKPDKTGFLDLFVENHYGKWIQWALNKPKTVIIASVIIFFGSLSLMPLIGVSFFPKADKSQLMINAKGIDGTNLANTEQALIYIENEVAIIPEVEKTASTIGEGNPQVYYNMLQPNPSATLGQVYVMLKPTKPQRMNEIIAELRQIFDQYPRAIIGVNSVIICGRVWGLGGFIITYYRPSVG